MKKMLAVFLVFTLMLSGMVSTASGKATDGLVLLRAKFKCGCSRDGMGAMIANNTLVTAAHNIVCHKHNRDLKECNFFFGWDGKTYNKKYTGSYSYRWYSDFSNGYKSEYDIAYVVFDSNVVSNYFDYGVITDYYDWEHTIKTIKAYGYNGNRLVEDWGSITYHDSSHELSWLMSSSFSGCSEGGPIIYSYGSYQVVYGVHTSYSGNEAYGYPLFSKMIMDMIKEGSHVEPF